MQKSIGIMDNPFEGTIEEKTFEESKDQQLSKEHPDEDSNILQQPLESNELKEHILNHIGDNRISQLISYMLKTVVERYETEIEPEMMEMLQEEIKNALFSKISDILDALFNDNLEEWLGLLMIEQPNDSQLQYYERCRKQILQTDKLGDKITLDHIDDIAKMILQTTELKQELAKLINTLVSNVQGEN